MGRNAAHSRRLPSMYQYDEYDRGYGRFTTHQNTQYNRPVLKDVPGILQNLADVDMHAIQTSGNCLRNVTSDPLAGVTECPQQFKA